MVLVRGDVFCDGAGEEEVLVGTRMEFEAGKHHAADCEQGHHCQHQHQKIHH